MCAAGASLRSGNSKSPRDRGSTGTPCQFIRAQQREYAELIARGKLQGGRVKTHGCVRPANLRFPPLRPIFMGRSIIPEVTRLRLRPPCRMRSAT